MMSTVFPGIPIRICQFHVMQVRESQVHNSICPSDSGCRLSSVGSETMLREDNAKLDRSCPSHASICCLPPYVKSSAAATYAAGKAIKQDFGGASKSSREDQQLRLTLCGTTLRLIGSAMNGGVCHFIRPPRVSRTDSFIDYWTDMGLPEGQNRKRMLSTNNWTERAFKTFNQVFLGNRTNKS